MTDVPVRMPLPPAKRQGSIYENAVGGEEILLHQARPELFEAPAATRAFRFRRRFKPIKKQ